MLPNLMVDLKKKKKGQKIDRIMMLKHTSITNDHNPSHWGHGIFLLEHSN